MHEAFQNAVKHGYAVSPEFKVEVIIRMSVSFLEVEVRDFGKGTNKILKPPDVVSMVEKGELSVDAEGNRIGWGLFYIHNLPDECEIHSTLGEGTAVRMKIFFL
ncbi:MAG: ATP-binding protein [Parcubacteria group bacterium]|nr:ATP-binding protein [Parcubacteria group bacterium]